MQLRPQSVRGRKEGAGKEVAGWLLGFRFGGCGGGRESVGGSVCVWRWSDQSSQVLFMCSCMSVSHKPLITTNGMFFVCVLQKGRRRPWLSQSPALSVFEKH